MLNHIVMMKFKPDVTAEDIDALETALDELPNKIVEIHSYEFGPDIVRSPRSYDFALVSVFANQQSLQRYQEHPEHVKVVTHLREICDDIVAVDFESKPIRDTPESSDLSWDLKIP